MAGYMDNLNPPEEDSGRLHENIMHFGRVLRQSGLPVGPGKVIAAIQAVQAVGLENREDFYWALHAVLVNRREHKILFDQAFHIFWRNPKLLERMMGMLLPAFKGDEISSDEDEVLRRIAEALSSGSQSEAPDSAPSADDETRVELDASLTYSAREQLAAKDFEKMSLQELSLAKQVINRLVLPVKPQLTRRYAKSQLGSRIDMHGTLRATARRGGDMIHLRRRRQKTRQPPLVVLCDISGSMDRYARVLLFFLHALANDGNRMHSFLFGTRLTNITRNLRYSDPDTALESVSASVMDWSGGTRIGACLHSFNRDWSRRVLAQGAVVLLITDGLDREGAGGVAKEMERLRKSCRKLIWLNPLLRFDRYEPKSLGAKAMMAHVDEFRPVHNLVSLAQLGQALGHDIEMRAVEMRDWRRRAQ